jgi:GT2 family glycosyltransferase
MTLMYSIIIPTGYRERYLALAIADLVALDFPADRFEIIIVDDTPDGANRQLVESSRTAAVDVRYVRREGKPGINAGRNTGIAHSNGDVLAFLDDDCRIDAHWLAALDRGIQDAPRAECFGGPIRQWIEPGHPRWCQRDAFPITVLDHGDRDRYVDLCFGANFSVRRSALQRVGLFDENSRLYGDEVDWMLRLRRHGGCVRYIAAAGVLHTRFADDVTVRQMLAVARLKGRNTAYFDRVHGISEPPFAVVRRALRLSAHALVYRCWSAAAHAVHAYVYAWHTAQADARGGSMQATQDAH